jgi:type IV pilus assembly protein PilB
MTIFKKNKKDKCSSNSGVVNNGNRRLRQGKNVEWKQVDISPEMFKLLDYEGGDIENIQGHKGDWALLKRICDRSFIEEWRRFSDLLRREGYLPLGKVPRDSGMGEAVYVLTGYLTPPTDRPPFLKLEEWHTLKSIISYHVHSESDIVLLGTRSEIVRQAIDFYYYERDIEAIGKSEPGSAAACLSVDASNLDDPDQIQQGRLWLRKAIFTGASDIHFEPRENDARIRYRVDGEMLTVKERIPLYDLRQMITWIKAQSGMDIAERRRPIDGRIKLSQEQSGEKKIVDVRISIIPTTHGQKMVMRLLDPETLKKLASGGLRETVWDPDLRAKFNEALKSRDGIVLVTGPTGSGKTTTLNAALFNLLSIHGSKRNIVTIEDPVEYNVSDVNQVQVNEKAGVTFAKTLRAMLRQDPDIILVGEIRDSETASVAIQAALTGHLILATLHTNDALGAAERLHDLGATPFLIGSTVRIFQAQRLVRMLCPQCGYDRRLDEATIRKQVLAGRLAPYLERFLEPGSEVYEADPQGCPKCNYTSYLGRTAVMEIAGMSNKIISGIEKGLPTHELVKLARQTGFRPMIENGIDIIRHGVEKNGQRSHTTLSEIEYIGMNIQHDGED